MRAMRNDGKPRARQALRAIGIWKRISRFPIAQNFGRLELNNLSLER